MITLHRNVATIQTSAINRRTMMRTIASSWFGMSVASSFDAILLASELLNHKAVINIHLDGGPPQMDMIDLKPDAPAEIRGEFQGIQTKIPGFSVCELLPKIALQADKIAFIRSLVGSADAHDAFQCQSGFVEKDLKPIGGRPALGSVLAKLQGSGSPESPAFVDMMQGRPLVRNSARPGFLGRSYQPFRPDLSHLFTRTLEPGMIKELAARGDEHTMQLTLPLGLSSRRVIDRVRLGEELDRIRKQADLAGEVSSADPFTQQALKILTSGRFANAMDLTKADPRDIARYTLNDPTMEKPIGHSEGAESTKKFLMARRLVEAGVRCVSLSLSDFDTHSDNFPRMRRILPILDHGLATLVEDLSDRGMLDDVSIVVWGEFGRTPKIDTKTGGRHHWSKVAMAMLAGGGIRAGQVIGSTDRQAGSVLSRPVHVQEVLATVYHHLGIDPTTTLLEDPSGRPQQLLVHSSPIQELI